MKNKSSLVRFDWAIKRLLRQKSNFVVLEGLLSTLLGENVIIVRILESEGTKQPGARLFSPYAIWHIQGSHRVYS